MKDINAIGVNNLLSLVSRLRKSQHLQDLFVLSELNFKSNGFFVEFDSTDGLSLATLGCLKSISIGTVFWLNQHWYGMIDCE